MDWSLAHDHPPDRTLDGGALDCGGGLLLLIRKNLDPLLPGQTLEVRSTEPSVDDDLPAWSRMTGNVLLSRTRQGGQRSFLVRKAGLPAGSSPLPGSGGAPPGSRPAPAPGRVEIPPLAVMGIGSWPRPRWMLQALHDHLEGRLGEDDFQRTADDAVRLAVAAQERAGADVITDGEQRRDNYASFVGLRLDNCQLVPITDLLPYVDDPDQFAAELRALDVPADRVRHPAVLGPLTRSRPLAVHELAFARSLTDRPVKVALPGPYLLTRTMWLECVSDRVYREREALAEAIVAALRAEALALLEAGAALVQFDEPVLTEVVFGEARGRRSFMCGTLGERRGSREELAFAGRLLGEVVVGLPRERVALHVCRGNWSRDEGVSLTGDYTPLLDFLASAPVGSLLLEMCTPRAGELDVLRDLPNTLRLGLGVVNQKHARVEAVDEVVDRAERMIALFGPERVTLNPDCGFATFADNPLAAAEVAEAKFSAAVAAARILRARHGLSDR